MIGDQSSSQEHSKTKAKNGNEIAPLLMGFNISANC